MPQALLRHKTAEVVRTVPVRAGLGPCPFKPQAVKQEKALPPWGACLRWKQNMFLATACNL